MLLQTLILLLLFVHGVVLSSSNAPQCGGYASCSAGKADMLNIHLVPHGHCDTGWDKTVDQYYYGSHNNIMNVGIQYNLDAIIQGLMFNKERRFTWIEVAYFWRWWGEQDDNVKAIVRQMVNEGRLMFGNNAWNMNDEASALYQEIIDQHTLGERFLVDTFGSCGRPLTAWQIDTFGHSREMASLLAQMGHDSLYFARLDYQDENLRRKTRRMELLWHGSGDLGSSSDLFVGILNNLYLPPPKFDFANGDEPVMDDPRLFDYNVDTKIDLFIKTVKEWALVYPTNHVFIPMGHDFDYELANRWFKNEDKLIKYVNARQATGSKINVLYSTIPCYTYAAHSANYTYKSKTDEFFPYASGAHTFWTGSFISRPTLKGYVRDTNAFLQTVKQLSVLSGMFTDKQVTEQVFLLSRGLAINLNHGQLPGTQTQAVAYDNGLRLSNGTIEAFKGLSESYKKLSKATLVESELCGLLNISQCSTTETNARFSVSFYNQLAWPVTHWARIPVISQNQDILSYDNIKIIPDIVPVSERTQSIPERKSPATYEAVFPVTLKPLGLSTYFFNPIKFLPQSHRQQEVRRKHTPPVVAGDDFTIENNFLKLTFSSKTNLLTTITDLNSGVSIDASIDLQYYTGFVGDNSRDDKRASGAYIFRPNEKTAWRFSTSNVRVYRGQRVQEVHQEFSQWATLVTRLYQDTPYVEVEWTVGPIPFQGSVGKEVIVNYATSLQNNRTCYTDSNGRQMMQRMYDYRETWNFTNQEPVAGNYNPINSAVYIRDEKRALQMTLLVDRAQGGTSLRDGQLELMVHRRLGVDDGLGVNQALNELGLDGKGLIARGRHWLLVNTTKASSPLMRHWMHVMQARPTVTASNATNQPSNWTSFSGLQRPLPANVKILTLEGWKEGQVLLRLEHIFQRNEDSLLSNPVTVDLDGLFTGFSVVSGEELSLAGALPKSQMTRLTWNSRNSGDRQSESRPTVLSLGQLQVTLRPMEIKTFALEVKYH